MDLQRLYDLIEKHSDASAEFRETTGAALSRIENRLTVLETQRDTAGTGLRVAGWFVVLLVSLFAVAASCH